MSLRDELNRWHVCTNAKGTCRGCLEWEWEVLNPCREVTEILAEEAILLWLGGGVWKGRHKHSDNLNRCLSEGPDGVERCCYE